MHRSRLNDTEYRRNGDGHGFVDVRRNFLVDLVACPQNGQILSFGWGSKVRTRIGLYGPYLKMLPIEITYFRWKYLEGANIGDLQCDSNVNFLFYNWRWMTERGFVMTVSMLSLEEKLSK